MITGLLFIGLSIYAFRNGDETLANLSTVFSLVILITGIAEIIFALSNSKILDNWGWILGLGIFSTIMGGLLFTNPVSAQAALPVFIGIYILVKSISIIGFSLDLKDYGIIEWGFLLVLGVIGIILSTVLVWNPVVAGKSVSFWVGLTFLVNGIIGIALSMSLKKLKGLPEKVRSKYNELRNNLQEMLEREMRAQGL